MKRTILLPTLMACVLLAGVACDDTTAPEDITIADLADTWVATAFIYTNKQDLSQRIDLVEGGGSFTMTINNDGSVSGTTNLTGNAEPFAGSLSVSNGIITLTDTEPALPEDVQFSIELSDSDDTLTMATGDADFDFDGDEVMDDAELEIVLVRQ